MILARCVSAVFTLMPRILPISLLLLPSARSCRISRSRGVKRLRSNGESLFGDRTVLENTSDTRVDRYGLCRWRDLTAAIRLRSASSLRMYPRAPAPNTSWISDSESCIVKINTSVFGDSFRICRVASTPFNNGMLMSSTATSGFSSLAFSTASRPLLASAHTSHPLSVSSKVRRPVLTT